MKKIFIGIFAFSCLVTSVFTLSWSGLADNSSAFAANNDFSKTGLVQKNGIYLSVNSPLNSDRTMRLSAECLYKFKLESDFKAKRNVFTNIADCDLLKFSGKWNKDSSVISLEAGRFGFKDFSGYVFSQCSDGIYFTYDSIKLKTSVYAGYTGLLNRLNVSMTENKSEANEQWYKLCPAYIPLVFDISYKALFEKNTISFQGEFFVPVDKEKNKAKAYGTLAVSGPVGTLGNYNFNGIAGTSEFKNAMLDTSLDFNFFVLQRGMLTAGCEYISGKQGPLSPFVTISTRNVYLNGIYDSGLIVPKCAFVYVQEKLVASLTEKVIFSMPEDKISLHGFNTAVNFVYNLFSDVQLGCEIDAFLCSQSDLKRLSNYSATLKASLAF